MIAVEKIRFKNILSFGNTFTTIEFDNNQSVLVKGTNGSGKSSAILDSLCYAFYGKPFRKINKPSLVNYKNNKDMVVEVWFKVNANSYHIVRGMSPSIFEIYKDGTLINQDASIHDYQEFLEKQIIKIDYQTFNQIAILGKATYVAFLKLKSHERRRFIENVLNLTIFSTMNEINKNHLSKKKSELDTICYDLDSLKKEIKLTERHLSEKEDEIKKHHEEQRQQILLDIEQYKKDIAFLEEQKQKAKDSLIEIGPELESLNKKIETCYEYQYKIKTKLTDIRSRITFFGNNHKCPTCESDLDDTIRDQKITEFSGKESELEEANSTITAKIECLSQSLKKIQNDVKSNQAVEREIHSIDINIQNSYKQITALEKRLIVVPNVSDRFKEKRNELKCLYEKQKNIIENRSVISNQLECHNFISSMLKDTGIKSMIIRSYIPEITTIMNSYLHELGLFARFELNENFIETIIARGINELNYENFSEGEKLRIDLAMLLTWREICKKQSNMNLNFLIFDEILDSSADMSGIESLIHIFRKMKKDGTKIIVISHSDQWSEKFDRTWEATKEHGFSVLKQNT